MYYLEINHMDLKQIAESGQTFMCQKLGDGFYRFIHKDQSVEVRQISDCCVELNCSMQQFHKYWKYYFDVNNDYDRMIQQIDPCDDFLIKAAEYGSGIRILQQDFWDASVCFVISQNNNIPKIQKTVDKIMSKNGNKMPSPEKLLKMIKDGELDDVGLGYRKEYLMNLAETVLDDSYMKLLKIACNTHTKAVIDVLKIITGIGDKVANCIALFGLGRIDCCPVDTWIKKIIDKYYNGVAPKWMSSPYAGYYQQLAFYYERSLENAIHRD